MEPYKFSDGDGGKHFKFVGHSLPEDPTNEEAMETFCRKTLRRVI